MQEGKLFMLQCRSGKRTGQAAFKIAVDLVDEGVVSEEDAMLMVGTVQKYSRLSIFCECFLVLSSALTRQRSRLRWT